MINNQVLNEEEKKELIKGFSPMEIYDLFLSSLGCPKKSYDTIFEIKDKKIIFYEDVSYHGSPNWKPVHEIEISEEQEIAFEKLKELKPTIEKISLEMELKKLEKEKDFIQRRINDITEKSSRI